MRSQERDAVQRAELARSRFALALLIAPLILGLAIRVEGARATLFGVEGPTCVVGGWCGPAGCPGCGLTRSTALVLRGDLAGAAAINWAGIALVLACVAGIVLHLDILLRARRRTAFHARLLAWGARGFAASVLGAWLLRLI